MPRHTEWPPVTFERLTWLMALGGALIAVAALMVDRVEAARRPEAPPTVAFGSHV